MPSQMTAFLALLCLLCPVLHALPALLALQAAFLQCNQRSQVLIPKIEISWRQYDWSVLGRALARFDSGKRTETSVDRLDLLHLLL
jgi:hypothetical protein